MEELYVCTINKQAKTITYNTKRKRLQFWA